MESALDITKARSLFPSLSSRTPYIYADNAGGSQCCRPALDRIVDYLTNSNVRLGGGDLVSRTAGYRIDSGIETARILFNAKSEHEVALGSSASLLLENLAKAIEGDLCKESEIIVTGEHAANVTPWRELAMRKGLRLSYWNVTPVVGGSSNPYEVAYNVNALLPLITKNTQMVAINACSNILGSVVDIKAVVKQIRAEATKKGVRKLEICVDCVAYAPHRRIDVQDWDVDYAVFSFYKIYGPHISALYTRLSTLPSLKPRFHSPTVDKRAFKIMSGGPGYELVYGASGVLDYLLSISPIPGPTSLKNLESIYFDPETHTRLDATFKGIAMHEHTLLKRLLGHLTSEKLVKRGVRVVGEERVYDQRTPTISFVIVRGETGDAISGKDIVAVFDAKGTMGIRYGYFSAQIMLGTLKPKVDVKNALVRISLVHYNTVEEVDKLIEVLDEALGFRKKFEDRARL